MEFGVVKVWGELVLAMQSKEVLLGWHDSFVGKRRANPKDGPTFNYVKTIQKDRTEEPLWQGAIKSGYREHLYQSYFFMV